MASVKGIAKGIANISASYSYGGTTKTAGLTGQINVVTVTTGSITGSAVGDTLAIPVRSTSLSSVTYKSGGPVTSYYVVGGVYSTSYPKLTATYTASNNSTTIYYDGFKNAPTATITGSFAAGAPSDSTNDNGTHKGSISISTNSTTSASALSGSLVIKDGSFTITTISLTSAAITLSQEVTATGYSADTAGVLTINGSTLTAAKTGSTTLNATYGGKSCDIPSATHYVGSVSVGGTGFTNAAGNYTFTRPKYLTGISVEGGSDDVSVLVGSTANYTPATKVVANFATSTVAEPASISASGFNDQAPTFSLVTTSNGTTASSGFVSVSGTTLTTSADTATGTAYLRGKIGSAYIYGLGGGPANNNYNKIVVTNESTTGVDVTSYATYTSSNTGIATIS